MTKGEWLEIGFSKGIIDAEQYEEITFRDAFKEWFVMKKGFVEGSTLDRIECTYNRYYYDNELFDKCISTITDSDIIHFLSRIIYDWKCITYKEFGRIFQIITGTCNYMRDIGKGGCPLHDWEHIRRALPMDKLQSGYKKEDAIPYKTIQRLFDMVTKFNIYPEKYCGCLMLIANFYMGLRLGELASLTFEDFDFTEGVVKIRKTESKAFNRDEFGNRVGTTQYKVVEHCKTVYSIRKVPIMPEVKVIYELIKRRHEEARYKSPYLCYDGSDCILVRSLDKTLRRLCKLCEVPYFNSHAIRKTFGTVLHFNGVPTRVISDLMGHSEISTTEQNYILSTSSDSYRTYMRDGLKFDRI